MSDEKAQELEIAKQVWANQAEQWVKILNDHKAGVNSDNTETAEHHILMLQRLLIACDKEMVYAMKQKEMLDAAETSVTEEPQPPSRESEVSENSSEIATSAVA